LKHTGWEKWREDVIQFITCTSNYNNNNDNLYGAVTWPYHYKGTSQTANK